MIDIKSTKYYCLLDDETIRKCYDDNLTSFSILSYDSSHDEYLSKSNNVAINFENIVNNYCKKKHINNIATCDSLHIDSVNNAKFVEFKNGNIFYYRSGKSYEELREINKNTIKIQNKIIESSKFLSDKCKLSSDYPKKYYMFYLVYNYKKMNAYYKRILWLSKNSEVLLKNVGLDDFVGMFKKVEVISSIEFDRLAEEWN